MQGAVDVAEARETEGQVFYRAGEGSDFDDFADVVLIFCEDEDAVDDVFEERLRAETDADAEDTGGCEQGSVIDVEELEDLEEDEEADDGVGGAADDGGDGADLRGAAGFGGQFLCDAEEAIYEVQTDPREDEEAEQDDEDFWQTVSDHVEHVLVPAFLECGQDGVVEDGGEAI